MARLRTWQLALLALGFALFLGVKPATVINLAPLRLFASSCGRAFSAAPMPPIQEAMLNVTRDCHTLAHLVAEFLQQPGVDPAVEQRFQAFLQERAAKSYPRLESALDWLLAIYKFLFPFLIISLVAKLQGPDTSESGTAAAAGEAGANSSSAALAPSGALLAPPLASSSSGLPGSSYGNDRRRQLAVSSAIAAKAKAPKGVGSSSSGGWLAAATDRAGSQSPAGPETPMEGGRQLPEYPALRQAAGASKAWQWPTITEISAENSY